MTLFRRRLTGLILALSLLCSLVPAGTGLTAVAAAETQKLGLTLDKVNVRYGASTGAKIMFSLPADHVCVILEEKNAEKIHWYKVETINPERKNSNTYYGYIHGDFFRELTPEEYTSYNASGVVATPTPIPESQNGQPTPTPTPVPASASNQMLPAAPGSIGVVNAGGTNLREGPGTGYRSLMKLERNTQVTLMEIPAVYGPGSGTFFKVSYNGNVGYIMSDYVSILSGGATGGETVVTTPTPTPAPTDSSSGNSDSTITQVKLILSSCHLRTSPGGPYDSENDWLGMGSTLPLAGRSVRQAGYTWYPVTKNGKTYYVRNDCVQLIGGNGSSDKATAAPTPEPSVNPAGLGYVRTTKGGCNLRATINGTVIKQIAKNVTMPYLLEPVQKNGYTWYFVQADSNRGYLRSDVVKVVSAPDVTPTPTPGPTDVAPTDANVTPTPTPEPENKPTGWVRTISSGVNLRKKAGYTDRIGQVNRDVVMPYYGEPTTVKGVEWYYVYHTTLGYGYLHGSYVNVCNEDGSAIATPTPAPGTTVAPDGGAAEASYSTLKLGSSGTAVKNLVTELKNQGYFTGNVTSRYTTAVENAVKAFQKAKGISVDGIAGAATQHLLFGTVPIGSSDTSNLTMVLYPAEKIDWYTGGINELWARGSNYKVYDVKTGIVWWAHRWAGGLHVDAEPLTAADTARLCRCYGVTTSQEIKNKNLYQRRPLLVTIGSRTFACSLYGVPHNYPEGDTISTNDFKGQVCIHFTNSQTHDSRKVDSGHEAAIQYAWENAPNGHK